MPSNGRYDSIFWVEVERIKPNPFQPRKTFDEAALQSLAESIRRYGVLQPLTVTRKEIEKPGEGIAVEYELIAGERRLRAAKLAGMREVPVVIRTAEDTDRMKLELAIIENLQREDLNADRSRARVPAARQRVRPQARRDRQARRQEPRIRFQHAAHPRASEGDARRALKAGRSAKATRGRSSCSWTARRSR